MIATPHTTPTETVLALLMLYLRTDTCAAARAAWQAIVADAHRARALQLPAANALQVLP